jgi:hypothetical protein
MLRSIGRSLGVLALVALALPLAVPAVPAVAEDEVPLVATLDFTEDGTDTAFWHGGEVGSTIWQTWPVSLLGLQTCERVECFSFRLEVAAPAAELRLAIDVPERLDSFDFDLVGPDGSVRSQLNANRYNDEIRVEAPPLGIWRVDVRPRAATDTPFGMRAGLLAEPQQRAPDADGQLLPNLRMTPPFEFGFVAPANPFNGLWPPDELNPPLAAAGVEPLSCAADEVLEEGARRCLRFSFGLENAGDGNFDIRYTSSGANVQRGEAWQCVEQADGPPVRRPAGHWHYHHTHGHDHYEDIVEFALLRVVDADAEPVVLADAGGGRKLGYSPADQHFADWDRFTQHHANTAGSAGNCAEGTNRRLGLSRGWGDVYRWQRPGNYVEFGDNPDGEYVVRAHANPLGHVLESSDEDNVAYAHIRVTGDDIVVLEQGRGLHPWDDEKIVLPSRFGPDLPSSRAPRDG